ncbi:MAG: hypothetical protein ACREXR_24115, partial [Gammaproteobacteria bacterium]
VVILTRDGRPVAKVHAIDPDQAWFWTPEWQAKEREVDEEMAGYPGPRIRVRRGFSSLSGSRHRRSIEAVSPTYARELAFAGDFIFALQIVDGD